MVTPYDWQEAIGHRAQFIEARLASAVPVVAVSLDEGIVAATFRKQTSKIYEIYDRLMYAAIGQQSDIESLRVAAIDFAHREGYNRSEQDVSIQRIVTAMSQPIKDSFANFAAAPWVGKALFFEIGEQPSEDRYMCLEYDGDYVTDHQVSCLHGTSEGAAIILKSLASLDRKGLTAKRAVKTLREIILTSLSEGEADGEESIKALEYEAAVMARNQVGDRHFERIV
ncbi:MAG: hypothetical protein JNM34_07500 [Chthonomonadaceae bacterium]|jgi:proteasome alpha subunit|nr:hypothetical protein [Chthonomonadaceae bacterium]